MIGQESGKKARYFSKSLIFLVVIMLFVAYVRIRLLDFPLERDEGEYAYMGQLILQGVPPYSEAYNMKFPGTYLMYALIMALFGQTIEGIHLGLLVVNCASIILLFLVCREIINEFAAVIAAGVYAVLSLSYSVFGFAAHATHFVILTALGGILLLLHALKKENLPRYFWSGALLGLSFVMKQPGIFFGLFGAVYLFYDHYSSKQAQTGRFLLRKIGIYCLGASAPALAVAWWIYAGGAFDKFWFWTVRYAFIYGSQIPPSAAFPLFRDGLAYVVDGFIPLWLLSALGLITLFFHRGLRKEKVFILLFVSFSFLSVCPGFNFRQHYFVTFLPAVAILTGFLIDFLTAQGPAALPTRFSKYLGAGVFVAVLLAGIVAQKEYFFRESPSRLSRTIYGLNPFDQSIEIAKFIKARSTEIDTIAVLGSEPQLLFYAKRRSATGYIYTYCLMEQHEYSLSMQKEMIGEIETSRPKFIVVVNVLTSWLARPESENYIFGWINNYLRENYELAGVANLISPDNTVYKWGEDARNYTALSPSRVLVYERK